MAKQKKAYAIHIGAGRVPDIVETWAECKKRIHGFPGAIYKGFESRQEALAWLLLHDGSSPETFFGRFPWLDSPGRQQAGQPDPPRPSRQSSTGTPSPELLEAYVDGSFTPGVAAYGYGVVLVRDKEVVDEFSGYGNQPEAVALRNVAGEMLGSVEAVRHARRLGAKHLILYFDYQGLQSWALGTWKRNNVHTQAYHRFMQQAMKETDIRFCKVRAHSGDPFNDRADELAKQGIKEFLDEQH